MYAIPLDLSWAAQEAACALASDNAENAHIEDMEYRSELAVLRHYIENRLAAFALAVSTSNPPALTSLLKRVRLHWIVELGMPLPIEADDIIDWLWADTGNEMITGLFQGTFERGPQVWKWSEHSIRPAGHRIRKLG